MKSQVRLGLDAATLVLLAVAAMLVVLDVDAPARTGLALAAVLLVPGAAALTRVRVQGWAEWVGLTVAIGLALQAAGALVMVWSGWWHPAVLAGLFAVASTVALTADIWIRSREVRIG